MEKAAQFASGAKEDEQLIVRIAQGNRAAFGKLYDRFSTPLYSLALKMMASEAEAQDLLHEVFLSVWNKASQYRADRGSVFSWLMSQMRNRAIDRLRSRRRQGELLESNARELRPSGAASSAENAVTNERAKQVRAALAELSEEQQEVLQLAYFEGLTQVEISEKLEEPLGTIKARAHRGMARLRDILRSIHE